MRVKAHNDGMYSISFICAALSNHAMTLALPSGAPRIKAPEIIHQLRSEWNALSPVEKTEVTQEAVSKLEEMREMQNHGTHNVSINAFHDVRATVQSVQTQV